MTPTERARIKLVSLGFGDESTPIDQLADEVATFMEEMSAKQSQSSMKIDEIYEYIETMATKAGTSR